MSNKRQIIEALKTCLIVLLSVSAVYLAAQTRLFDQFFASIPLFDRLGAVLEAGSADGEPADVFSAASTPSVIVVTGPTGHYAGSDEALYESTGAVLGEALGSSHDPATVTAAQWEAALSGTGLFFEYPEPVRLSVLAGWFGTSVSHSGGSVLARRIAVSVSGDGPVLYYADAESGEFFRCATAASPSSLTALTESYLQNGAAFVYELGSAYDSVDPYMVAADLDVTLPKLSVLIPLGVTVSEDSLLNCFDMNSYISSKYTEQSGDAVYVEGDASLRIESSGLVTFKQDSSGSRLPLTAAGPFEAEVVESARAFLQNLNSVIGGDTEFRLHSCTQDGGVFTVSFDRFAAGRRIFLPGGASAARLVVENGCVVQARIYFRSYTLTDESVPMLPALQALAIADSLGWRETVPGWADNLGGSLLTPDWLLKGGD